MLELRQITKTYETAGESVHALKGVDISFRENEFVSILGSSGCGKTTLLNIMGGLDHYTSGDLIINGVSTKEYADADWDAYRNHSIGFVFQSYNLIPHQTVLSNVELALTLSGVSPEERRERAVQALTEVGLGDQLHKKPTQMSGGQMQRVAIARALINNPDILLADEPTGALDSETSVQIMDLLKKIASNRLVIMVTHNPELAETYSTRIIRLQDGLVIGDTNPLIIESGLQKGLRSGLKNKSMSMATALGLSFNNLMTKKARTILTAFAGSIGIIGIALILSVSAGFQNYIDKIENDTLSSYPLIIQSESANMTSMLAAFAGGDKDEESKLPEGKVQESQYMGQMFANIGANDLAGLKKYIENDYDNIGDCFNDIIYNYGITPQIFSSNLKYGPLQVNPSTLMNSPMSSMMAGVSTMGNTDIFFKLTENPEADQQKYKIAYGKWPEKYNELVLVLDSENTMNDYMSYSLGLRDPKEMTELIGDIMSGKDVDFDPGKPLDWTYEDLMKIVFSLVHAADEYEYNSTYGVYKSKAGDKEYMKKLIKDGEKLRITCIAYPDKDNAGGSVDPGIGYLPSLTDHVVEHARDAGIVKKQLADKKTDVFSGKSFKSLQNGDDAPAMGFSNLISIDKNKLASAFGGKVSEEDLMNIVKKYSSDIDANITADISSYENTLNSDVADLTTAIADELIADLGAGSDPFTYDNEAVDKAVSKVLISKNYSDKCSELANMTGGIMNKDICGQMLSPTLSGYGMLLKQMGGAADAEALKATSTGYADSVKPATKKMAETMTEAVMKATILTDVGKLTGEITGAMASAFKVDPSAIASAFKFNMSDEDIQELVQAMSSGNSMTTYDNNLRKLGYADYNKPSAISFYLKDFAAKQRFIDYLADYNKKMEKEGKEDSIISYTDITGTMMKSVKTITNAVSYVLIAFVAISLIVSSIMIGIITYISVLERTKEIGILRAIGASKKDISRVFNSETIVVGLCAGIIGILITLLLLIPINIVFLKVTGIAALKAKLPVAGGIILIIISVILTFIAGLIPSGMAAKKDPVEALRTE